MTHVRHLYKLGLYNGLLIGLALALGAWGPEAIDLRAAHLRLLYPSLLCGGLFVIGVGGLAGWLVARFPNALLSLLLWLLAAGLMTLAIGRLPYEGRSWLAWLADRRFWGLPIYPFEVGAQVRLWLSGFFILLVLAILGGLQGYRLEAVYGALTSEGRLSSRAWFLLALPLPVVLWVGLTADETVNRPLRLAPRLVSEAIDLLRAHPAGDLRVLSRQSSSNLMALAGVRGQVSGEYALSIGEMDLGAEQTVVVVADFENGAWINCRVFASQLSYCDDAGPPYRRGFPALLTGQALDDCPECAVTASAEQLAWLRAHGQGFGDRPSVARLAQWGSYVLMRAGALTGGYAIDCLFHGFTRVELIQCAEVFP